MGERRIPMLETILYPIEEVLKCLIRRAGEYTADPQKQWPKFKCLTFLYSKPSFKCPIRGHWISPGSWATGW
jgi:hypothetical protein